MPRKAVVLALVMIALHVVVVLALGTSASGSFIGNSLQIIACGLATAMALGAFRRGTGLSKPFWLLVACGVAVWGVANLGWMYYEILLRMEPPTGSAVRFLFGTQVIFFAMALLLDQEKNSAKLDAESLLDFIQIGIVFFFIFLGFYYLPAHHMDAHRAYVREIWLETGEDVALVALALIQAARARTEGLRKLYSGFAAYLLFFTISAGISNYAQSIRATPTGTWLDLTWTLPLLGIALWAAAWEPTAVVQKATRDRRRNFAALLVTNATFAVAPLIVLIQVAELGSEGRLVRFSLLGLSIVCYAARLGISQYREGKTADTLMRHNRAMDSAVNGIAVLNADGKHTYANNAFARMMGRSSPESIVGEDWQGIYDPSDVRAFGREIREGLQMESQWCGA